MHRAFLIGAANKKGIAYGNQRRLYYIGGIIDEQERISCKHG